MRVDERPLTNEPGFGGHTGLSLFSPPKPGPSHTRRKFEVKPFAWAGPADKARRWRHPVTSGFGSRPGEDSYLFPRNSLLIRRNAIVWVLGAVRAPEENLSEKIFACVSRGAFVSSAIDWFNRAIAIDSAFGNAWLGRGLCRIRRGDTVAGVKTCWPPPRSTAAHTLCAQTRLPCANAAEGDQGIRRTGRGDKGTVEDGTIADLAGAENLTGDQVSEAMQYRSLDRQIWGRSR